MRVPPRSLLELRCLKDKTAALAKMVKLCSLPLLLPGRMWHGKRGKQMSDRELLLHLHG